MLSRFTKESDSRDLQALPERTTGVGLVDAYLRLPEVPTYAIIGGTEPASTVIRYGEVAWQACRYLFRGQVDLSDEQVNQFVLSSFEAPGPKGGRAPKQMRKAGLEWALRLAKEPARLWTRYLIHYPAGVFMLLQDCLRPGSQPSLA